MEEIVTLPDTGRRPRALARAGKCCQHQLTGTAGYQPVVPARPGWQPYGRVPFISLFLLANIPDCLQRNLEILYDLSFLD